MLFTLPYLLNIPPFHYFSALNVLHSSLSPSHVTLFQKIHHTPLFIWRCKLNIHNSYIFIIYANLFSHINDIIHHIYITTRYICRADLYRTRGATAPQNFWKILLYVYYNVIKVIKKLLVVQRRGKKQEYTCLLHIFMFSYGWFSGLRIGFVFCYSYFVNIILYPILYLNKSFFSIKILYFQ